MIRNVFPEMAGRYVLPSEGVTLATLGVPPYSPPPEDWDGDDRASFGSAEVSGPSDVSPFGAMPWAASETTVSGARTSFVDMLRTISPTAEPDVWRQDNRAPFWSLDDQRALSRSSFDDLVRTIDPRADPDLWREDDSAPRYAGWDDPTGYAVPYDPRAVARGAVRVPKSREKAAEWVWHDRLPGRVGGAETPAQLASMLERWIGLELLGADFTPHGRGGYPSISGGGIGAGGGGGSGGGSRPSSAGRPSPDPARDELAKVWTRYGGTPGGRSAEGAPATSFVGRTGARAGDRLHGTTLGSHNSPPRNPPGVLVPSGNAKPIRSTAHGMDKVQDQGYVPSVISQVQKSGKKPQSDGSWLHYDPINDIFAVFNKIGELVTTYPTPRTKKTK